MAALNKVASYFADEIRDGIAWVIIWKTGRSWHGYAAWLDPDTETFEPDDLKKARKVLEEDPNAVMLNGYYCGHFGEDMNALEIAAGIRWHYENGCNLLDDSDAWPAPEAPFWEWCSGLKLIDGDLQVLDKGVWKSGLEVTNKEPQTVEKKTEETGKAMELTLTIGPDQAKTIAQEVVKTVQPAIDYAAKKAREFIDWAIQAAGEFAKIAAESLSKFMDAMLYSVNTHPKWWHLYKHAKKYRVRKKYRKRLMQQLIESLRAAPDPLEVIT